MKTLHPAVAPVRPSACALAVAIPMTRERFLADLSELSGKDLAKHFISSKGLEKADPEFCWKIYEEDELNLVKAVCREVERLGVTVRQDVRLECFTELLNRFRVVTLVAHWRFVPLITADIHRPLEFLNAVRVPRTAIQNLIRKRFEELDSQLLETNAAEAVDIPILRSRIARVVQKISTEAEQAYTNGTTYEIEFPSHDSSSDRLTRLEFEQAFPANIAPSRVVEFSDAMHTVPDLVKAIPEAFSGLLDLTICNSVIPASAIRQLRPNCLVAANRLPAELKSRMYLYGLEMSLLSKKTKPFVDIITEVHTRKSTYEFRGRKRCKLLGKFFSNILAIN
jgi:hypothetical protein